ncbi:ubiquitin-associated protein 1-like [Eucyclogobius newberryi]|uniref:ubiquitin-associated protein 1-like n=1 Tax=Eucyclogobius newberryi TaxID=166745 RepID=UPI003B58D526
MNTLEDVPFQTVVGPLQEGVPAVTAPKISIPDCAQILQETQYEFSLEKWILSGQQLPGVPPSCPPYWLLSSSQDSHRLSPWAPSTRPRSYSLNSADSWLHHRTVKFLLCGSEEDCYTGHNSEVYYESSPCRMERPQSAAPRVKELHGGANRPESPQELKGHRNGLPSLHQCRPSSAEHRPQQVSPQPPKNSKKRHRSLGALTRKYPQNTATSERRLQQQRPSSAGPAVKNLRQKALNPDAYGGAFLDTAAELLSALSQEERELLETITQRGYTLRRAVMALQKTGYRNPEKILKYLVASERLCQLGHDEGQVEEALEMFQNCEDKAAEFLQLLTQFKEMGFQQSAIKEVLLVHENHREKALEELMTHLG